MTDTALLDRLGQALAPAYEMEGELGRGGMAIVYRARDVRLKRRVAIKLLPPDLAFRADIRSRFMREAETAARLSHPNIVPIYAVDERDGLVFFVMALVTGGSVGDRLKRGEIFSADDTRRILREVADALDYAHRAGVVHRDIKPDNILLDGDTRRAMVTDFGIARAASDDTDASRLTATGAVIGTPTYMSPEQCAGDREIDGRSDLYSLGTVAYQMLTGEAPFSGGNAPSIMVKHVTEKPIPVRTRVPTVPADLSAIVMRLLEKAPADRFATGRDLVDALDGAPLTPLPPPAKKHDDVPKYVMDVHGIGGHGVAPVGPSAEPLTKKEQRELRKSEKRARTLPDRVRKFRGNLFSYGGTSLMLFGINAATSGLDSHLWFIYPTLGMMLAAVIEMGTLVGEDGVPLKRLFFGPLPPPGQLPGAAALPAGDDEVLNGPHGAILRQAMSDRQRVRDLVAKLSHAERRMLPDVQGTADALYERIDSLAHALHQLDFKMQPVPKRLADIDNRIAEVEKKAGEWKENERKLSLLRRQREVLVDLEQSRARLHDQYESAGLLLQNLALDLLKVRSSGLDSALSGINNATQEARALSREIGYVLNAADELRGLEGKK